MRLRPLPSTNRRADQQATAASRTTTSSSPICMSITSRGVSRRSRLAGFLMAGTTGRLPTAARGWEVTPTAPGIVLSAAGHGTTTRAACGRPIGATSSRSSASATSVFAAPEFRRARGGAERRAGRRRRSERSEQAATTGPPRSGGRCCFLSDRLRDIGSSGQGGDDTFRRSFEGPVFRRFRLFPNRYWTGKLRPLATSRSGTKRWMLTTSAFGLGRFY